MAKVVIIGGGGQASVVADSIESIGGMTILGFVTEDLRAADRHYPVLGIDSDLPALKAKLGPFELVLGLGDSQLRQLVTRRIALDMPDAGYLTVIHPRANIASRVTFAEGCFVALGASVGVGVKVGAHALINTNASVDHDCVIAAYASISPNVALGGAVQVGEAALIGIGATVLPGLKIGAGAIIGAGAVVTKDVAPGMTVMGIPARVTTTLSVKR
jgi:UDP-perosamine 4-acetyltransferase